MCRHIMFILCRPIIQLHTIIISYYYYYYYHGLDVSIPLFQLLLGLFFMV